MEATIFEYGGYPLVCLSMFACKWVCYDKFVDVWVCFCMLCSLLKVLVHHLWVQFSQSTLFYWLTNPAHALRPQRKVYPVLILVISLYSLDILCFQNDELQTAKREDISSGPTKESVANSPTWWLLLLVWVTQTGTAWGGLGFTVFW